MSEGILVLCEAVNGTLKKTAFELLGKATELAGGRRRVRHSTSCRCGRCSESLVNMVPLRCSPWMQMGEACQWSLERYKRQWRTILPAVVLGAASAIGRDAFARLSARTKSGLGGEITEMRIEEGALVAIRPQFSGKVFSQVQISTECKLFTVRPGSFAIPSTTDAVAEVVEFDVDLEDSDSRLTIVEIVESQTEAVDLTEADRIVSGGRSVKSKDNFDTLIRPLAQALRCYGRGFSCRS